MGMRWEAAEWGMAKEMLRAKSAEIGDDEHETSLKLWPQRLVALHRTEQGRRDGEARGERERGAGNESAARGVERLSSSALQRIHTTGPDLRESKRLLQLLRSRKVKGDGEKEEA